MTFRQNKALGDVFLSPTSADLERWRGSTVLESMTVYQQTQLNLAGGDEPLALKAVLASPNFTDFTGAAPILGRAFTPDDAASESAARVVLLSEGLWKRRFGADPGGRRTIDRTERRELPGRRCSAGVVPSPVPADRRHRCAARAATAAEDGTAGAIG